jgi:hypothetical protein
VLALESFERATSRDLGMIMFSTERDLSGLAIIGA